MSTSGSVSRHPEIQRRLLRDVSELRQDPYPRISIHPEDDLSKICLVLTPEDWHPLHLTIEVLDYPTNAPKISIQSMINHPNVHNEYICASILNTQEGYTPAYTLKAIAIQLLSFFNSENVEQDYGGVKALKSYRNAWVVDFFRCKKCGFDGRPDISNPFSFHKEARLNENHHSSDGASSQVSPRRSAFNRFFLHRRNKPSRSASKETGTHIHRTTAPRATFTSLPDEIVLQIFEDLSSPDIWAIAKVSPRIRDMVQSYDFIRMRELQCFYLKDTFLNLKLGVGVRVTNLVESEFDLISKAAFDTHKVRKSIHGQTFHVWLPVALSRRHWRSVSQDVETSISKLGAWLNQRNESGLKILARFLTDIVVKFSQETNKPVQRLAPWARAHQDHARSTLTHASEKAVEAYFTIFHLLLCVACEQPDIVRQADQMVSDFLQGKVSKVDCPNVGVLIGAALICTSGLTEPLMRAIINESIKRNVVWMLDSRGQNMPELAYFEPSAVSEYRMQKTFEASLTSYRLLMFYSLFYRIARADPTKPLSTIRNEMFDRHGAPPPGTSSQMAGDIRRIKTINSFPDFMREVGINVLPSDQELTSFLRNMIVESEESGYSKMPITQSRAYALRRVKEPDVEVAPGIDVNTPLPKGSISGFFPGKRNGRANR